jgi:hypothetical protein
MRNAYEVPVAARRCYWNLNATGTARPAGGLTLAMPETLVATNCS